MNIACTTTTITASSSSANSTNWYIISNGNGDFTVCYDPITEMKKQFMELNDRFFEQSDELHTNREMIERWQRDERLAHLVTSQ